MFERLSVKPTSKLDLNPFITQVRYIWCCLYPLAYYSPHAMAIASYPRFCR
jgi:hypothetical protein